MSRKIKFAKPKEPVTTTIISLSHDGRGIAHIHDKKAFITEALPHETVTCQLTSKRRQYYEANLVDVITASPDRVTPPCPHYAICGGCSLQHMSMQEQLRFKENTLLEQLKMFGRVTPAELLTPLNAETLGYRRKARLGVKYVIKKNKLLVGFREKATNYLADLSRCLVLYPKVGEQLQELAKLISSLTQYQHIPQIEVAVGDQEVALVFRHLEPLPESDIAKLVEYVKIQGFQLYLQPNPPAAIHKVWPQDTNERLSYTLPKHNLTFLFHPLDFTQINLDINRLMVDQALDLLDLAPEEKVLDLFCGIGNFTLPMAQRSKSVVGIEGSAEMVQRAQANAVLNQLAQKTEFFAANLAAPTELAAWTQRQYDKILLDPPRVGAREILPLIAKMGAKRIVYVSCNPATLARDAGDLVHNLKYRLQKVGIMNMFPHTSHVEAMAVFDAID